MGIPIESYIYTSCGSNNNAIFRYSALWNRATLGLPWCDIRSARIPDAYTSYYGSYGALVDGIYVNQYKPIGIYENFSSPT